jgi:hypothetical protein
MDQDQELDTQPATQEQQARLDHPQFQDHHFQAQEQELDQDTLHTLLITIRSNDVNYLNFHQISILIQIHK